MTDREYMYAFGKNLKRIMRSVKNENDKSLTQKQLSELTDIPEYAISLYIQGERLPNLINLRRLVLVLGCTSDDLTDIDDNTYKWAVDTYGPMKRT